MRVILLLKCHDNNKTGEAAGIKVTHVCCCMHRMSSMGNRTQ